MSNNDRNGEAVLDSSLITLPELGLSNKEVEFDDDKDNEEKLGIHPEDLLFTGIHFFFSQQKSENMMEWRI